jgi:hypothetical protein
MAIFRQYIVPFLILLVFLFSLMVVSARIWLPSDMMAPAPVDEELLDEQAFLPSSDRLSVLINGLPDMPGIAGNL